MGLQIGERMGELLELGFLFVCLKEVAYPPPQRNKLTEGMSPARKLLPLPLFLLAAGRRSARHSHSQPANRLLYRSASCSTGGRSLSRRVVSIGIISLAGGVALSAINDLAIFHGCTSKAIEKAIENREVVEAIGLPIVRGPWYDASLAVGHRRRSVSCTFPISGPQGSGLFQIKAIRNGEDGVLSFLRHHDWEILIMDACLEVPLDDDKRRTLCINLTNNAEHASVVPECKSTGEECEEVES